MTQPILDYLVIGHVTRDIVPSGWRAGGTVTFSALTAHKLGCKAGVLTSASCAETLAGLDDIATHSVVSTADTVFENIYTPSGRVQYLRSVAATLSPTDLPAEWRNTPIIHLGPVAQEVSPEFLGSFPGAFIGLTPQGWLRRWNSSGQVHPISLAEPEKILGQASCVVLSLEDLGGDKQALEAYAEMSQLLVQTRGMLGAIIYMNGSRYEVPAFEAREVDPTGAGDVFATAFLIRYYETRDPLAAALFANCVASFVIEGPGTSTIPSRDQVHQRLQEGKLRQSAN